MTAGSSMLAITLSCPPQRRQVSMSMAKTRLRRCAQVSARCQAVADSSPRSGALLAAAARLMGTTRARAYQLSDSMASELAQAISGSMPDEVMFRYIGGAVSLVEELFLALRL